MHCAACANRNERALKKLHGVREAAVNFGMRNARVEFDPAAVTERALHDAVIGNGFQVLTNEFAQDNKERAPQELAQSQMARLSGAVPRSARGTAGHAGDRAALDAVRSAMPACWSRRMLSTIVILGLGWGFHRGMLQQALRGAANMDTLISIGTLAALLSSAWALYAGGQHLYFETGAVIAAFILLGRYFEARSRGQASAAIEKLVDLGAKTAHLVRDGREQEIAHRRRAGRRCAAREARREGPRRRQGRGGALQRRRGDAHGREHAGDQDSGRRRVRRHHQHEWRVSHAGHQGRAGHHAGPDRQAGGGCAGQQGADPEAGRQDFRDFRADRARGRRC